MSPPTSTNCKTRPWPCVGRRNWLSLCSAYPIVSFYCNSNWWIICPVPLKITSWIRGSSWRRTPWSSCSTIKTFLPICSIKVIISLKMSRIGSRSMGNYFLSILTGKFWDLFFGAKIHLSKISFLQNLLYWNLNFHKIHIFEISFLQNSLFWNLNFHKIHISEISKTREFLDKNWVFAPVCQRTVKYW